MKLRELLARLAEHQVRFSVIGGVALIARGVQRATSRLLGEVAGLGTFEHVDAASSELEIAGSPILVLTLDGLERAKRAAGRPKDLVDLGYIHALKK